MYSRSENCFGIVLRIGKTIVLLLLKDLSLNVLIWLSCEVRFSLRMFLSFSLCVMLTVPLPFGNFQCTMMLVLVGILLLELDKYLYLRKDPLSNRYKDY